MNHPQQQKMITVSGAQRSQSGASITVTDSEGNRYSCKQAGIQSLIGQALLIDHSQQNFPDGGSITWINSWTVPGIAPPQQPAQAPQAPITPQAPAVDRDASIVAQCLCKTVTFSTYQEAWRAYVVLYGRYMEWSLQSDRPPQAESEQVLQAQQAQAEEYSDDIPF